VEIKSITYKEVEKSFSQLKPDLLDEYAKYYGCFIKDELVGVVSYVEHPSVIYLCHAYVKEEHRTKGIYKLLKEKRSDDKINNTSDFYKEYKRRIEKYGIEDNLNKVKKVLETTV
jgi:hypothetical protein